MSNPYDDFTDYEKLRQDMDERFECWTCSDTGLEKYTNLPCRCPLGKIPKTTVAGSKDGKRR